MAFFNHTIKTGSKTEMVDITHKIRESVSRSGIREGICIVFIPHTTAAVTINEAADPSVQRDIIMEINKIVPRDDGYHHMEGNSAAHIKSSIFGASSHIPVKDGDLSLGTWQGIFFCEFDGPRNRHYVVHIIGEK